MREWKYKKQDGKEVWKELEKAMTYNSRDAVFTDWLDLILNSLLTLTDNAGRENLIEKLKENKLNGEYNEKYLEIVKKYGKGEKGKRPIDYLCSAWGLLVKETQEKQKDILGDIYMEMITFGQHGQFFTPEHITDAIVEMADTGKEKICDPCCGSGRFLISAGKKNKDALLVGTDLDDRCVKMAVLNMWMFDLNANISRGNSLLMETYETWKIRKGGYVYNY
jgi:type I restriction-modification system DNA methylase subunit